MNRHAKQKWLINLCLLLMWGLSAIVLRQWNSPVRADGGSWETDGVLANTTEADTDRMVLINTRTRNIMVYRTQGVGEFRLVAARWYAYDLELPDTHQSPIVEQKGVSFAGAYELYQQAKKHGVIP